MNDFFDLITTFFAELTNEEKILLGILSILVFLIGVVVGWIVQGSKTRRYKKELLLLRKDRDEYEVRYRAGETKQKALAKELEEMSQEKVAALDRLHALEAQQSEQDDDWSGWETEKAHLQASLEELEHQVQALEAENIRLQTSSAPTGTPSPSAGESGAGAGAGLGTNDSLNAYIAHNEARLQSLEDRLLSLARENAVLQSQSRGGAVTDPPVPSAGYTVQTPTPALEVSTIPTEPLIIRADTTEPGIRTGNAGGTEVIVQTTPSIQVPPIQDGGGDAKHDDLTRIREIGPHLQAELNKADIYSYAQIASWSEADIVTYTELIGYLPGIIQRDDWVGQAQRLLDEQRENESAEPHTDTVSPEHTGLTADANLRLVEGIGPKIETVLKDAGITTLSILADTSSERLREILESAGSRYKSHDPKTWPVQAGLAADGKLIELKAWQQELKGGK